MPSGQSMESDTEIVRITEVESLEAILGIVKGQRLKFFASMNSKYVGKVSKGKETFYTELDAMVAKYATRNSFRHRLDAVYALKKDGNTNGYSTKDVLERIQMLRVLDWSAKGSIERVEGWLYYLQ